MDTAIRYANILGIFFLQWIEATGRTTVSQNSSRRLMILSRMPERHVGALTSDLLRLSWVPLRRVSLSFFLRLIFALLLSKVYPPAPICCFHYYLAHSTPRSLIFLLGCFPASRRMSFDFILEVICLAVVDLLLYEDFQGVSLTMALLVYCNP